MTTVSVYFKGSNKTTWTYDDNRSLPDTIAGWQKDMANINGVIIGSDNSSQGVVICRVDAISIVMIKP